MYNRISKLYVFKLRNMKLTPCFQNIWILNSWERTTWISLPLDVVGPSLIFPTNKFLMKYVSKCGSSNYVMKLPIACNVLYVCMYAWVEAWPRGAMSLEIRMPNCLLFVLSSSFLPVPGLVPWFGLPRCSKNGRLTRCLVNFFMVLSQLCMCHIQMYACQVCIVIARL